jgi:flagellar biosynthetic protein FliS
MYKQFAAKYQRVALESAPPPQLLDEMYTRLERDLRDVSHCIEARDRKGRAKAADHSILLIEALWGSLDHNAAPALCAELERLYEFVLFCINQASFLERTAPIDDALRVLRSLQDSFRDAAEAR